MMHAPTRDEQALRLACDCAHLVAALKDDDDLLTTHRQAMVLEDDLTAGIMAEWTPRAEQAAEMARRLAATGMLATEDILREIGVAFDGLAEAVRPIVEGTLDAAYILERDRAAAQAGIRALLNQVDEKAVKWLQDDTLYWIGTAWDRELGGRVAGAIADTTIAEGMSFAEAGERIKEAVADRVIGKKAVNYWEVVANAGVQRSRSFGAVESFAQAGVVEVGYANPEDERTTPQCLYMVTVTQRVEVLVDTRDRMLDAASPEEAKAIMPWLKADQIVGKSPEDLAALGVSLPPFHGLCLLPWTLVLTQRGWIAADCVADGDNVLTHAGRWSTVAHARKRWYSGDVVGIVLDNGAAWMTAEHPVLTAGGSWVQASRVGCLEVICDPEAMRNLRGDVRGIPEPCRHQVLLKEVPQPGKIEGGAWIHEASESSQGASRLPSVPGAIHGCSVPHRGREGQVLLGEMQEPCSLLVDRAAVPGLREAGECFSEQESRRERRLLLHELQDDLHQDGDQAAGLGGQDGRREQPDVREIARASPACGLRVSDCRASEPAEHVRGAHGRCAGRSGDPVPVRGQAVSDGEADLCAGFLPVRSVYASGDEGVGPRRASRPDGRVQVEVWPYPVGDEELAGRFRARRPVRVDVSHSCGVWVYNWDVPGDESYVVGGGLVVHNCRTQPVIL